MMVLIMMTGVNLQHPSMVPSVKTFQKITLKRYAGGKSMTHKGDQTVSIVCILYI